MKPEIVSAIVSGVIGLLAGVVAAGYGGSIARASELRKLAIEGVRGPSSLLLERRMSLYSDLIVVVSAASYNSFRIWDCTSPPEGVTEEPQKKEIAGIISDNHLAAEVGRVSSLCSILSTPEVVEIITSFNGRYQSLMRDPDHTTATFAMEMWPDIVAALRKEMGTDALSEHLLDQLNMRFRDSTGVPKK